MTTRILPLGLTEDAVRKYRARIVQKVVTRFMEAMLRSGMDPKRDEMVDRVLTAVRDWDLALHEPTWLGPSDSAWDIDDEGRLVVVDGEGFSLDLKGEKIDDA